MASKESTKKSLRKRCKQLTTDSGTATNECEEVPATKRKRATRSAKDTSTSSSTSLEKPTSSSSRKSKDYEPAKKQTRKTLKSVSSISSSSKEQVSSSQAAKQCESVQCEQTEKPSKKRKRRKLTLNKKERQALVDNINKVDASVLSDSVLTKLSEQCLADPLQTFADALFSENTVFRDILQHHRVTFGELYVQCKLEVDPFLQLQLKWHQHCAAFLLSRSYSLTSINLDECTEHSVSGIRI